MLHPWSAFLVMPVFALANAGLVLNAGAIADPLAFRVTLAVALGLLVGKPLGIALFSWLAVRAGLASLPAGVGWGALLGAGFLGGIGFTMALFITSLAFPEGALAAASKLGVIAASVAAAILGIARLSRATAQRLRAGADPPASRGRYTLTLPARCVDACVAAHAVRPRSPLRFGTARRDASHRQATRRAARRLVGWDRGRLARTL